MFAVVETPIDVGALASGVRTDRCGAVVTFVGVVRERSDDNREVSGLVYESHAAIAAVEMEKIAAEAQERFGECEIAMQHRVGELSIGEVSVAVAVGAVHRAQAFDACEYAIDELKRRAPIWKKERYRDGRTEWKGNS
ncbi:MAG: molybdenum cofactor biosynthesis protein MoaE [Candidatus Baltobacteraceae bacterium]